MIDELQDAAAKEKKRQLEKIARANDRLFQRECEEHGIDPAAGVSPSLIESLAKLGVRSPE